MSIFSKIDFDKISAVAYSRAINAVQGWVDGRVMEEPALLNRVIENFRPTRRGCDVGTKVSMVSKTKIFQLHRKGVRQIDKFGSDLAITLKIDSINFCKTAFFQFKKSKGLETTIQKEQLTEAGKVSEVFDRSFVFVADELRQTLRIRSIKEVDQDFDKANESSKVNCESWDSLIHWLSKWLQCQVGKPSDPKQNQEIENHLQGLSVEDDDQENEFKRVIDGLFSNFPDYLPAKQWIVVDIKESDIKH